MLKQFESPYCLLDDMRMIIKNNTKKTYLQQRRPSQLLF